MKYRTRIVPSAERQFRKFQTQLQNRIAAKITQLADHPRPHGSKKLRNTEYYRIRIGDYRALYSINDSAKTITILDLGHRRDIYR